MLKLVAGDIVTETVPIGHVATVSIPATGVALVQRLFNGSYVETAQVSDGMSSAFGQYWADMTIRVSCLSGNVNVSIDLPTGAAGAPLAPVDVPGDLTLDASHHGRVLSCSGAGTHAITVPGGLAAGFSCAVFQSGTGKATASGTGATLRNSDSHYATAAQYAVITILNTATDIYAVGGQTGA